VTLTPEQREEAIRLHGEMQQREPAADRTLKTYDPKDVVCTFNGVEIKGFADGTFVEVSRDEPCFVDVPPRHLMSGTCTLTLIQEAEGNAAFNDIVSRLWSIDTGAFLAREAKKDRRRVRMARKRRRGWA